ncbi:MAG: hypothetical protein K2N79_03700, partial [Muribaculaceae bacterium]|nr:hypothetical protein [Muribaculaceae bacterium]
MKQNKLFAAVALILAISAFQLSAQDILSPYSRFGYGNLRDQSTSAQRQMGGVGYAMQSGRQINAMNPASYAAIDSLTFLFDMGVNLTYFTGKDGSNKASDWGGGLDYITLQFPVGKILGASIGLVPYSTTGYSFGDKITNGAYSYQGEGGINLLYGGIAIRPYIPGLSIGANVGYLFGTTRNDNYTIDENGSSPIFERVVEVRDYYLSLGLQYNLKIARDKRFVLGATFAPGKDLRGKTYGIKYDINTEASTPDTTQVMKLQKNYTMPHTIGAGLSFNIDNRLSIEADYTYQPWKDVKFTPLEGFEGSRFDDRWKIAVGAEYIPNFRGNWIQRVRYRLGIYHDRDYIKVGTNNVKKQGITLGFGLPAPASKCLVNLGLEYCRRQAYPNPLVKENYLYITLGINFNELWFWQNRLR